MTHDRRTFLKRSGAVLGVAAVGPALPDPSSASTASVRRLDAAILRAVAEVVLPSELGDAGREEAVADFEAWANEYEPVAEMNHGYGTSEIRYGPPDPVPAWTAQLEALEIEAQKRSGSTFAALDADARRALLQRQPLDSGSGLPNPLNAEHVAVALMAHWFRSPDAKDRCYDRRIAERRCRGIDTAPAEPESRS
jgi:hypothetical protein